MQVGIIYNNLFLIVKIKMSNHGKRRQENKKRKDKDRILREHTPEKSFL
jgi:hypothetical protein